MDSSLLTLLIVLVSLVAFDLLSLRFGADSRHRDRRPNWW